MKDEKLDEIRDALLQVTSALLRVSGAEDAHGEYVPEALRNFDLTEEELRERMLSLAAAVQPLRSRLERSAVG